jgi:phosphoglucosamine mutase
VATITSNVDLEVYLESLGLGLVRTPVGHHVVEYMRQHGYNVGGEQPGHIVLSERRVDEINMESVFLS